MQSYSYQVVGHTNKHLIYRFLLNYRGQHFAMDFNCPRLVDISKANTRSVERHHVANCLADFRRSRNEILQSLAEADTKFRAATAESKRRNFKVVKP